MRPTRRGFIAGLSAAFFVPTGLTFNPLAAAQDPLFTNWLLVDLSLANVFTINITGNEPTGIRFINEKQEDARAFTLVVGVAKSIRIMWPNSVSWPQGIEPIFGDNNYAMINVICLNNQYHAHAMYINDNYYLPKSGLNTVREIPFIQI